MMWKFLLPNLAVPALVVIAAFAAGCIVYLILGALTVPKEIPPEERDE